MTSADSIEPVAATTLAHLTAHRTLHHGIARRATELQLAADPALAQRFGATGRDKFERDTLRHLTYLDEAVRFGSPALFIDYAAWAKVLLAAYDAPGSDLVANLGFVRSAIAEQAEQSAPMLALLESTIELVPDMPVASPSMIDPSGPLAGLARRYLDLLLANRRRDASRMILEAVDTGTSVHDIYLHVFQPAQYEIGRLWQTNEVSVAQEHLCTATTQMIMSQLYPHVFSRRPLARTLVSACVADDLHEIGSRILADFFAMAGWDTHYVGASTPANDVGDLAAEVHADVVALSATMTSHIPNVQAAVAAVRAASPASVILVGGYPFQRDPQLAAAVGADGTAMDANAAVAAAWPLVEARRAGAA